MINTTLKVFVYKIIKQIDFYDESCKMIHDTKCFTLVNKSGVSGSLNFIQFRGLFRCWNRFPCRSRFWSRCDYETAIRNGSGIRISVGIGIDLGTAICSGSGIRNDSRFGISSKYIWIICGYQYEASLGSNPYFYWRCRNWLRCRSWFRFRFRTRFRFWSRRRNQFWRRFRNQFWVRFRNQFWARFRNRFQKVIPDLLSIPQNFGASRNRFRWKLHIYHH